MGNCCGDPIPMDPDPSGHQKESDAEPTDCQSGRPSQIIRLFMVGQGEVGKSTIIKQMQKLCLINRKQYQMYDQSWQLVADPLGTNERKDYIRSVHQNILRIIATLIKQVEVFGYSWPNETLDQYAKDILEYTGDDVAAIHQMDVKVTPEMAQKISNLWNCSESPLRKAMRRKYEFFITDSTEYFLSSLKLHEISQPDYVPTPDDIIRARDPTTGVKDYNFKVHKTMFSIHDMGGQPVEKKRMPVYLMNWLRNTQTGDKNFILYVASLSDYNQKHPLHEGYTLLDESIQLLKILLNMRELESCGFMLFLNKRDIFEQKLIQSNDFQNYFTRYIDELKKAQKKKKRLEQSDNISIADAEKVIESVFAEALSSTVRQEDTLYCRKTCAVDTQMMESIFAAVRSDLIHDLIRRGNWVPFP